MKFKSIFYLFSSLLFSIKMIFSVKIQQDKEDTSKAPIDKQASDEKYLVNTFINRGYSMIKDNSDYYTNPSTMLADNNIFAYTMDIGKVMSDPSYKVEGLNINTKEEKKKLFKYIKDYNFTEVDEAEDLVVNSTDLPVLIDNYLIRRARLIKGLINKTTIVYTNQLKKVTVELDSQNANFPKLNDKFITDTIKVFAVDLVEDLTGKDNYLSQAYDYLKAYGTHYITNLQLGAKMIFIGEFLKPTGAKGAPVPQDEVVIKAGSFDYDDKIKEQNRRDDSNEIMIKNGHCDFDKKTNDFTNCQNNYSKLSLISMYVEPLYNLFKPGNAKIKNFKTSGGVSIDESAQSKIYNNMKNIIQGLLVGMDARNSPIADFYVLNNLKMDDLKYNACLRPRKLLFKKKNGSLFGEHFKVDTNMPVYGFAPDSVKIKFSDKQLTTNSAQSGNNDIMSTYACLHKTSEFRPEALFENYKFNKVFIKKIYFKPMDKLEEGEEKNCTIFWTNPVAATASEDIIHTYLCTHQTNNPFDKKIITDVKFRNFNGDKCENTFKYLDRQYKCLCTTNMLKAANEVSSNGKYLCYSRRIELTG